MKRTTMTNHVKAFKREAMHLLRFQLASQRISLFYNIKEISRSEFADQLIALKAIENDMVIRVCKFDDNTKGVHSFIKAVHEIPISNPDKVLIEQKTKQFGALIKDLKQNRRNEQLAHLKINSTDGQYVPHYHVLPAINLVIEIIDLMAGSKISYLWKDGQYEEIDLRAEVLKS